MNITRAGLADLSRIHTLLTECGLALSERGFDNWNPAPSKQKIEEAIRDGNTFMVTEDGQLVGTVTLLPDGTVKRLAVHPRYQSNGLGRRIMQWVEEEAERRGVRTVKLDAIAANSALIQFYTNLGYNALFDFDRDGWRFTQMEKRLTAR